MVFRNPQAHTQAIALPGVHGQIQYAQATAPSSQPSQHLTAPQPTIATAAVLPVPESSAIPTAAIQFAFPASHYPPPHAHPLQFAQPIQLPAFEYAAIAPQHTHAPQHSFYQSPFDFFHQRQPASLLDSYIPSSVILAQRQRGLRLHALPSNFQTATLPHPTHFYHQGSHQPGYNTIAYSTAQGFSKRSPKLTTDRPLKLSKLN